MITLIVGTKKGAAILQSDAARKNWSHDFALKGWGVTASARDDGGRTYLAVSHDVYGPAIFVSDDMKEWKQLESAPRFNPGDKGNATHIRMVGAFDFMGRYKDQPRLVDQIWTLHAAHGAIYAGVSEAGLFVTRDRGQSWQPIEGFNDHPNRANWEPGGGGLCAHTILTDVKNPNRMWVGVSSSGFFRTDDGGKTWAEKSVGVNTDTGTCVHHVAHDPANADVLFRQDHRGVYRSDDAGDHWRIIESGLPCGELNDGHRCSFGFPIVMDRPSGDVFIAPLDSDNFRLPPNGQLAVYKSSDGENWCARTNGLPGNCYSGVLRGAMAADQRGGVYFGTSSGAIYGSADLGESWSEIAASLPRIMSVEAYAT
jgi:photosystem II stability/assembly factor-like uncharacterized protein